MFSYIPFDYHLLDKHYFPDEEYQLARVSVNERTGKEEVIHYSYEDTNDYPSVKLFNEYGF